MYRRARALRGVKKILIGSGCATTWRCKLARVHQGTGHPPRRRLPEDRARAHRRRAAVQDDEAGHRQLRPLQAAVRAVQRRGRQEAVPDPVLHRRAPGHQR